MKKFDLAWETFEFHSFEGARLEDVHYSNLNKIQSFKENGFSSEKDLPSLKNKILKDIDLLVNCYLKQLDSINELINIHDTEGFPKDMEMSKSSLYSLKSLVATLVEETKVYHSEIQEFLS